MEDAGGVGLVCSFVLHSLIPDGQGIKAMSEGNLEFCFFRYFADNKWTEKEAAVGFCY